MDRRLQVDGKYFFVKGSAGRMCSTGKNLLRSCGDEEILIKQARKQFPNTNYFIMNEDKTAFVPDEKHEWMDIQWEDKAIGKTGIS